MSSMPEEYLEESSHEKSLPRLKPEFVKGACHKCGGTLMLNYKNKAYMAKCVDCSRYYVCPGYLTYKECLQAEKPELFPS